ncbi:hypothetical protein EWH12_01905 [Sphingobium cupriresistens]|uniref:Uncharacterized protein n=1 Tax=Sphingobium cupriresistens TaxID=1132417 RepID=A0A8G2E1C7_9SPHN|nr:hypothetical protein EWH12_01905 [Sphingobium cupriresistens]
MDPRRQTVPPPRAALVCSGGEHSNIPPLQGSAEARDSAEGDHEVVEGCRPVESGTPLRRTLRARHLPFQGRIVICLRPEIFEARNTTP